MPLTPNGKAKQAVDDIETFIEQAEELDRYGSPGSHWPEYVWTELMPAAVAGVEYLKQYLAQPLDRVRDDV